MEKPAIERQLEEIIIKLYPKIQQAGIISSVLPKHKFLDIDTQLENSIYYLRVCTSDLLLEVESLRRENQKLRDRIGDR